MKLNMYSIFDSAASAFIQPFFMHNDGLAIRAFQDNVNATEDNNISKHPEQFTLFKLGTYDDSNASFEILEAPKSIALGVELINDDTPRYTNIDMKTILDAIKQLETTGNLQPNLKIVE